MDFISLHIIMPLVSQSISQSHKTRPWSITVKDSLFISFLAGWANIISHVTYNNHLHHIITHIFLTITYPIPTSLFETLFATTPIHTFVHTLSQTQHTDFLFHTISYFFVSCRHPSQPLSFIDISPTYYLYLSFASLFSLLIVH